MADERVSDELLADVAWRYPGGDVGMMARELQERRRAERDGKLHGKGLDVGDVDALVYCVGCKYYVSTPHHCQGEAAQEPHLWRWCVRCQQLERVDDADPHIHGMPSQPTRAPSPDEMVLG